jgi:hypothetical protein
LHEYTSNLNWKNYIWLLFWALPQLMQGQCCTNGANLLANYNPDFSIPGNPVPPGFLNDNTYSTTLGSGLYSVIVSRNYGACGATPQFDHTTGDQDGDYLWFDTGFNATPTTPQIAWQPYDPSRPPGQENTLDVTPNTLYVFSVWIRDLARDIDCISGGAPVMGLRINGLDLAEIDLGDYTSPCCPEWIYLCSEWNSGNATQVDIRVESRSNIGFTDLGIDDVYFGTTFPNMEGILGNDIITCESDEVVLYADVDAANIVWNDGSTADSLVVTTSGIYWVEIDGGQCAGRDSITVDLSSQTQTITLPPDTTICENTSLVLTPSPSIPGNYTWQDGSTSNSYFVTNEGLYYFNLIR